MTNHPNRSKKQFVGTPVRESWHAALPGEPPCGDDEWRKKDRHTVIKIASMETSHLLHCVRFASVKKNHRSKLAALLAELAKRRGGVGRVVDLQEET